MNCVLFEDFEGDLEWWFVGIFSGGWCRKKFVGARIGRHKRVVVPDVCCLQRRGRGGGRGGGRWCLLTTDKANFSCCKIVVNKL